MRGCSLNQNAKKWLEALRSGKYKQGQSFLTKIIKEEQYDCCLGVACRIFIEEGNTLKVQKSNDIDGTVCVDYGYNSTTLPSEVISWLGLYDECGKANHSDYPSCVSMNDGKGYQFTFEQIANKLEENAQYYFREDS